MILFQKLSMVGGSFIVFSVVFGFLTFEQILKFGIRDQTALRKRNDIRGIYLELPFPMDFRLYFFNVSNPMEVQEGATPILEEIGPYCYDEYIKKIDVVDNDGEDSLTYSPYAVFHFNKERSANLSDDDYVTILHPLVVGMVNQVLRDSPAVLPILNKALGLLFPDLKSIYLTAKVKDILFDGIPINCKVSEFPAKAVCTQLKQKIPGLKITENEIYYFSLLGPRNGTAGKRTKVSRGISNSRNLGKLLELDGKRELDLWSTKECNMFHGTDGWIFPPLLPQDETIWSFSGDICRSAGGKFVNNTVLKGVDVRYYEVDLGDMEHNEEEKCYCPTPKTCLKKGVFDLTKCMGVPILATLPHFLRADDTYLEQVKGLNPVLENHIIRMFVEPMTTTPIEAQKRLQFNIQIAPNSKITLMKNIPEALHPIFWVEEGISLEGPLLKKVTNIFLLIKVVKIARWFGIITGLMIIFYGFFGYIKSKEGVKVTTIHEADSTSRESDIEKISSGLSNNTNNNNNIKRRSVLNGHEFDRYSNRH